MHMKKLFSYLLAALFVFNGCTLLDSLKSNPNETSYEGILVAQAADSRGIGTHVLETGDKEVLLRSLTINLSGSEYLGNNVRLIGQFNEDDGVFEVTGVSVLEKLSDTDSDAELEEYKDTDMGFSLKYYSDWQVESDTDSVTFYAPKPDGVETSDFVSISRFPFTPEFKTDEFGNEIRPLLEFAELTFPLIDAPGSLINKIGPDKLEALKMETESVDLDYYLYRNDFIYVISFISSEDYVAGNKKIFNQMVSEFRFLGFTVDSGDPSRSVEDDIQIDTFPGGESSAFSVPSIGMDLNTFESLSFNFMGKFPDNWFYSGSSSSNSNVLRHYGFSTESVTDDNEIIGLDFVNSFPSGGQKFNNADRVLYVISSGSEYRVNVDIDGMKFSVYGPKEYENLISVMASNISPIK